jgi:hypothetical protein
VRYFVDISTIRTASSAPPRGVTRVEYNVAREALSLGAKLVRFDEGARAFVAAELPTDFGRAHDEIALLLSETPTIRAPLLKRPGLGRARALGKSLALAALAASEAELETARKELAWRLAYNFEFLAVAERFELASHAGALPPQPLCHEFHYWITVERGKHHASNEPGTAPPMEFTNRDKLLSLGAVWKPEYIDGLEGLASRGVTVTALIYDMIPITHTGFLPSEEVDRFKIYLERMLRSNIRLTTISRSSRQEIAKYAQNTLGLCKDVAVTPLASSASTDRAKVSAALLKAGLQDREFVFMAGSIEPRKNQGFYSTSGRRPHRVSSTLRHLFSPAAWPRPHTCKSFGKRPAISKASCSSTTSTTKSSRGFTRTAFSRFFRPRQRVGACRSARHWTAANIAWPRTTLP